MRSPTSGALRTSTEVDKHRLSDAQQVLRDHARGEPVGFVMLAWARAVVRIAKEKGLD